MSKQPKSSKHITRSWLGYVPQEHNHISMQIKIKWSPFGAEVHGLIRPVSGQNQDLTKTTKL